jgi:zinc transport system permease protein
MRRMSMAMNSFLGIDAFFWRAVIGAGMLGLVAGPIGCFVLWRRMAYMGASIAEMALLGAALGLLLHISPLLGVLGVSLTVALLLARPWRVGVLGGANSDPRGSLIPADTLIGLIGHAGLALGFVALAALETVRADLLGYLFGDVLALSNSDIAWIVAMGIVALGVLAMIWRPLLADTVSPEILAAEHGVAKTVRVQSIFLVLVAALIAFGLKIVGALLIVALLIIPPAAARPFANRPETMIWLSAAIGAASAPLGLSAAFATDIPAGPAIVLAAAALFVVSSLLAILRAKRSKMSAVSE